MNKITTKAGATTKPANPLDFEGELAYWKRRALFQAEQANMTRMHDQHGHPINHAANVARVRSIREEQRRLADQAEYRADLDRRFEADKIRSENRR